MATVPTAYDAVAAHKLTAVELDAGIKDPLNFLLDGAPRCHVSDATGNVCTSGAAYKLIQWDNEVYDNDTMHDTAGTPYRVTFTTAGRYEIDILITMPAATYTNLDLNVRLNSAGSSSGGTQLRVQPFSDGTQAMPGISFRFKRVFIATDYIEIFVSQTSGASRTTAASGLATRLYAERLSAT